MAEIKAIKPEDTALQVLNAPKMVGGQVDILPGTLPQNGALTGQWARHL